ncbi:MAG: tryptophan-rich sensory protein [Lactococcus lactis]|nr:tryptophan-rich sensory protein [Lactococcus lactis]
MNKWSAFLLIPYFIWIIFATYLSISVAILN